MKIPANLIKVNYTSGNEYAYTVNYKYYQGYYYELNNKFFVGKEFNIKAPELIKITSNNINTLLTKSSTYVYGFISGKSINDSKPVSFIYNGKEPNRYFLSKVNTTPTIIKEVSEDTFKTFQNNPLYNSVSLSYRGGFNESELNTAEKQMPGLKTFLEG